MKYLILKKINAIIVMTLMSSGVFAQSESVFLNLNLGRTTYQEALRQVNNSRYRNGYKINNGSIYIVSSPVEQNNGMIWDYLDIHFSNGYINNIHFHSTSVNHNQEYVRKKYLQLKEYLNSNSKYTFWHKEGESLYFKYNGDCAVLGIFDSEVAGKVVRVQYIDL